MNSQLDSLEFSETVRPLRWGLIKKHFKLLVIKFPLVLRCHM